MGTSSSPLELASKMYRFGESVENAQRAGVMKASLAVKEAVRVASGPYADSKLTKVGFNIVGTVNPSAIVRMTSRKAHLLDHDTHFPKQRRPTRRAAGSKARRSKLEPIAQRAGVRTHGKFMWEKGITAAIPASSAAFGIAVTDSMLRIFR